MIGSEIQEDNTKSSIIYVNNVSILKMKFTEKFKDISMTVGKNEKGVGVLVLTRANEYNKDQIGKLLKLVGKINDEIDDKGI